MGAFGLRRSVAQPEGLDHRVGLLLDRAIRRPGTPPHRDDHERQKHGVDHAQGRVDEARNVVVLTPRAGGLEPVQRLEVSERDQATSPTTKMP